MLSSLCTIVVFTLLLARTQGSPFNIAKGCINDEILRTLENNRADALTFCRLNSAQKATTTQHATATAKRGATTVTTTVTSEATLVFTILKDFVMTTSTTALCSTGSASSTGSSDVSADPPPRNDPGSSAPGDGGAPPVHGDRDKIVPYMASLPPSRVSSACRCLNAVVATETETSTTTSDVPTVTESYTIVGEHPVKSYAIFSITRTVTMTSCVGSDPVVTAV